jgi:hypothetical protein
MAGGFYFLHVQQFHASSTEHKERQPEAESSTNNPQTADCDSHRIHISLDPLNHGNNAANEAEPKADVRGQAETNDD